MRSTREVAVRLVEQVFQGGAYSNLLLNKCLREQNFSDLDRKFLTELVYGTVKACGTLDWYLAKVVTQPLAKLETLILADLRVALFQILYMDRVPSAVAVDEAVKVAKSVANFGAAKLVNGVLRNFLRRQNEFKLPESETDRLAIDLWHPRELVKKWLKHYGKEATEALCKFNNSPALLCLRTNTLQITREQLAVKLRQLGVEFEFSKLAPEGIVCRNVPSLQILLQNCSGDFYIQDESSMLVAPLLAPKPGEKVLDLCSAPGGKTTHLAQLMQNQGLIVACDIYPHRLQLVENNAKSLGIGIIKTMLNDGIVRNEDFVGAFDKVLVDAPCSGLGVLRRRPEARWRKKREDLKIFPPLQTAILTQAAEYVKLGGTLVYSTCTLEQSENHYVVAKFLTEHSDFTLVSERQLLPYNDGTDGFYLAKLVKKW